MSTGEWRAMLSESFSGKSKILLTVKLNLFEIAICSAGFLLVPGLVLGLEELSSVSLAVLK